MPSRTLEDKVEDLTRLTAALNAQVHALQRDIEKLAENQLETKRALAEMRTSIALLERRAEDWERLKEQVESLAHLKITFALVERAVEELKKTKEEWSRRIWAMVGPILGAVVGVMLGYFLRR